MIEFRLNARRDLKNCFVMKMNRHFLIQVPVPDQALIITGGYHRCRGCACADCQARYRVAFQSVSGKFQRRFDN